MLGFVALARLAANVHKKWDPYVRQYFDLAHTNSEAYIHTPPCQPEPAAVDRPLPCNGKLSHWLLRFAYNYCDFLPYGNAREQTSDANENVRHAESLICISGSTWWTPGNKPYHQTSLFLHPFSFSFPLLSPETEHPRWRQKLSLGNGGTRMLKQRAAPWQLATEQLQGQRRQDDTMGEAPTPSCPLQQCCPKR
jgi:hypothetical protein